MSNMCNFWDALPPLNWTIFFCRSESSVKINRLQSINEILSSSYVASKKPYYNVSTVISCLWSLPSTELFAEFKQSTQITKLPLVYISYRLIIHEDQRNTNVAAPGFKLEKETP